LGYLQATVEFAKRHPEVGEAFRDYLAKQNPSKTE
jgi:UTP-glucose-1-phosphate uridylyltransferase